MLWRNKVCWLALVVKLTIRDLPLLRTGAVQCGGLVAMSHDLSHHKQFQLIMAHLSKGGSEGPTVFDWEEHGEGCLLGSKVTASTTTLADKLLDKIILHVVQLPHHCCHFTHL